jgi:phosphohistidine phosphatase SixA
MKIPARHEFVALVIAIVIGVVSATAQSLSGDSVVDLRSGGYVLVMRHAHSPRDVPDAASAHRDNINLERQLDADGRAAAVAMGTAVRKLGIPIGQILTSPTFRALETVRALGLGDARSLEELGDGGINMQPDADGMRSAWLRAKAMEPPAESTNTLMVTHLPNLRGAFGDAAADMADGETLILRSDEGRAVVVGRVRIDEWSSLSTD